MALNKLSYRAFIELIYMAPSDFKLRRSLISELLALDDLSYVALDGLSYWALTELSSMALLHSELRGSLISELRGFFVFLPLGKYV